MDSLVIGFVRGHGLASLAIEWFGGGGFSHVTTLWDKEHVLDSRLEGGVQIRPVGSLGSEVTTWVSIPTSPGRIAKCRNVLDSQVGKPYDKQGIWNFASGSARDRNWRNQTAWFCDELAVWSWEQAEICPELLLAPNRITPGGAALVASALGAVSVRLSELQW